MKKIVVILSILILFITGCSEAQSNTEATKDVTIGDVSYTIPTDPQKIVADYYVGEIIKLDANLVGADLTYSSTLWGDLSDIQDVGQSMELVASLTPDLIITMNPDLVSQYEVIAPTVLIPYGTYNPEDLLIKLGEITNREDNANQWVESFNDNIDELSTLVDSSQTYTTLELWDDTGYYYGENYGRAGYILYNKLGLKAPEVAEDSYIHIPDSYATATIESLPEYVGDNLILIIPSYVNAEGHPLLENVVYENLDAVKNNHVYTVEGDDFSFADPFSLDKQLEVLTEVFSGTYE